MRPSLLSTALFGSLLVNLACGAGQAPEAARPPIPQDENLSKRPADAGPPRQNAACALLSGADVEAVQGEAVAESQGTEHTAGALITSQCFYRLPSFEKSFSLELIRANPDNPSKDAVKEYLREKYERAEAEHEAEERRERAREKELERERAQGSVREGGHKEEEAEKREEKGPPRRISGVGDEAFWARNHGTGALFVRRGDVGFSLTLSGSEDSDARIRRATALARRILKRLPGK
jgi:hypothetical protein